VYIEIQYTSEWERRIFKKIGNYLMQNNKSISECFDNIDLSRTATVDMNTLKSAIIRFQLNLHDKELKTFIERIDSHKRGYITKNEFI
jgi:Ca2+-binding EF-hand superfamily protein